MTLLLICVIATVGRYLLVEAAIFRWLWSRYPSSIDAFLSCAACSGFWFTGAAGLYAVLMHGWSLLDLTSWETVLACSFLGIFTTPILSALHRKALRYLEDDGGGAQS